MKNIHVNRDGEALGQFDLKEIMAGLASGRFQPNDLAWRPGMAEWKPLNQFPDLDARPDSQKNTPESLPPAGLIGADSPADRDGPAWERREAMGLLSAMVDTIKSVLMSPTETFASMRRDGGLGNPLLFFAILAIVTGLVTVLYQFLIQMAVAGSVAGMDPQTSPLGDMALGSGLEVGMSAALLPIIVLAGIFISAGIYHLMLMMVGAGPVSFETTFRVCCYGYGAAAVLQLIPVCGGLISWVWGLVVVIIGFAQAHETSTGRSAAAVLIPLLLCIGLCGALFFTGLALPAALMATDSAAAP